jgi:hypothetical protein
LPVSCRKRLFSKLRASNSSNAYFNVSSSCFVYIETIPDGFNVLDPLKALQCHASMSAGTSGRQGQISGHDSGQTQSLPPDSPHCRQP